MEEPLLQTKSELNKLKSSKIQFSNSLKVTTPLRLDSIIYSQKDYDENISLYEFDSERESLSQVDDVENFIIPYTSKGDINEDSIIFKSKYSFIQTYLSLIKESKIIHSYPSML